jgi:hypothetical protein
MLLSVDEITHHFFVRLFGADAPKLERDPFPYVVVDDALPEYFVHGLSREVDELRSWFRYDNPLEKKNVCNRWDEFGPYLYSYFTAMLSMTATDDIAAMFGIRGLTPDVGLHGGGVHVSYNRDKLNVHQDYSIHPKLGLERRINVIFHVEPMWQASFGGHLELWSGKDHPEKCMNRVISKFNRMVIFATSPGSWHGFPEPINGVDSIRRKSLATYYVSELSDDAVERYRARYAPAKDQKSDAYVLGLIEQRSGRS